CVRAQAIGTVTPDYW
nr:immunoglobulin heavy chain junction region [Macaca mulatta]MOV50385.1 immunoglobulin heavy chain junction region [Macaca mulatta]